MLTIAVFGALVAVWCLAGCWLASHKKVIAVVERFAWLGCVPPGTEAPRDRDRVSGRMLGSRHQPADVPSRDDHAGLSDELALQARERTADDQESFTG